jgi:NAD(P)-dependent dehydrogenase (short-subunit alcohol dehydrogenase family)
VTEAISVALVAGATRGAGRAIAVELGRAGLYVYATGRSSRTGGPSEIGRPETIEETGELIAAAGGAGSALVVDHEKPASVAELVSAIEDEQGRLDVLVNDIFGGDKYMEWDKPLWEHDWAGGLRMLQMGVHTHLITCRAAIPLLLRSAEAFGTRGLVVEMTDGTSQANAEFRRNVGFYYDLVKANVERIVKGLSAELEDSPVTAVGVTPGWLRSEKMLENFGVSEANWRDACRERPGFGISESPTYVAKGVAALARAADAERWAGTMSALASSPTPTASQTSTEADRTAGVITRPTGGSPKTTAASTSSDKTEQNNGRQPKGTSQRRRLRGRTFFQLVEGRDLRA